MPLSSVVGAQSIVKPGVCTSSTRPASPYDGQMIYETDTDKVLVYNGSAWKEVPSAATSGAYLQTVVGTTTTQVISTSTTFVDTTLSATITPKYASSTILVTVSQNCYCDAATTGLSIQLMRGATVLQTWYDISYGVASGALHQSTFLRLDSPATTSSLTYKTQMARRVGAGQTFTQANNANGGSTILLQEISA